MNTITALLHEIAERLPQNHAQLRVLKTRFAAAQRAPLIRNDQLMARYREEVAAGLRDASRPLERILTLNAIRSESGIATVTVITEPFPCPGRCVYCPTEARAPKSYLTNEPAVMRALRSDYDPYGQVTSRLLTLHQTGHPIDKIELIIKGGTWSFYPEPYQCWFIQRCLDAANHFAEGSRLQAQGESDSGGTSLQPSACSREPHASLEAAQRRNETAGSRIIGITIETRPDYVDEDEVRRLRQLGVTRVELGVQSLDEEVLRLIARDHGAAEVRLATRLLKDAAFKVAYHLMPNLPGATPESDLDSARAVFTNPDFQPDTVKLYPCVVIQSAELYKWWRDGRYRPYDHETLIELLIGIKQLVPPHVRIERVIRDIPSTSIQAGCLSTNLRQMVQQRLRDRGLCCRCIRCRQVRGDIDGVWTLLRRDYEASGGRECFLSFEDPTTDRLASLLRLRIVAPQQRVIQALEGAALIRELHTYGQHVPLSQRPDGAVQHHGFGKQLLQEAERIAREEFGLRRIAVIAGVGVREYYRRFGYQDCDTYLVKDLAET
jgi:elongator complex protein 3